MNHIKKGVCLFFKRQEGFQVHILQKLSFNTSFAKVNANDCSDLAHKNHVEDSRASKSVLEPVLHRNIMFDNKYVTKREVWVENLDSIKEEKRGLIELNPNIFGIMPRLDIIFENVKWQNLYRKVVLQSAKSRAEMRGGGRKPHRQKGLGKARQGSIRAPHMINGGSCHGPRNPTSYFYMLHLGKRIMGLTSTLSIKFAQDDLHIVDNINIPTDNSQYILDLIQERNWGSSVLIINDVDVMPRNITVATEEIGHVTLMPLYGLNVYGMLKHETLVMTLQALYDLEDRLLTHLNSANPLSDLAFYNK